MHACIAFILRDLISIWITVFKTPWTPLIHRASAVTTDYKRSRFWSNSTTLQFSLSGFCEQCDGVWLGWSHISVRVLFGLAQLQTRFADYGRLSWSMPRFWYVPYVHTIFASCLTFVLSCLACLCGMPNTCVFFPDTVWMIKLKENLLWFFLLEVMANSLAIPIVTYITNACQTIRNIHSFIHSFIHSIILQYIQRNFTNNNVINRTIQ